jgi:hypothetical protein
MVINPTDFDDNLLVRMRDRIYQEMRRDYLTRHSPDELPFREAAKKGFIALGPEFGRTAREIHDRILQERSLTAKGVNLKGAMDQLKGFSAGVKCGILEKLPSSAKRAALAGSNELAAQIVSSMENQGIEVIAIYDNNQALHGSTVCGVEVKPFEALKNERPDAVIITSLSYSFSIRQQIEDISGEDRHCRIYDLYEFLS